MRVQLSNIYSTTPLKVGGQRQLSPLRRKDSRHCSRLGPRALLFSGKPSFSIPPGAVMTSDPVDIEVPQLSDLAISVYVPGESATSTLHSNGLHTTYISKQGDVTSQAEISDADTSQSWYWLSAVEVISARECRRRRHLWRLDHRRHPFYTTPNTDSSWPSFLASAPHG